MTQFSDLGLSPETAECLALEGAELPTALQAAAIPVVLRGNDLFIAAGSGAGVTWAWAAALVDRLARETESVPGGRNRVLVVTPTTRRANYLAENTARLAAERGFATAAIDVAWRGQLEASLLFGTLDGISKAFRGRESSEGFGESTTEERAGRELKVLGADVAASIAAVVIDQLSRIEALGGLDDVRTFLNSVPERAQRIVSALPVTDGVRDLRRAHLRRAPTVQGWPAAAEAASGKGSLRYRIAAGAREAMAIELIGELLSEGARHVLVFSKGDDALADLGDMAALRGYPAGVVGDPESPVWLAHEDSAAEWLAAGGDVPPSGLAVLSSDLPHDPSELDRRHGLTSLGAAVVLPKEMAHFRSMLRAAGYERRQWPAPATPPKRINALLDPIREALASDETTVNLAAIQPLFDEAGPAEVAAAAVTLWRASARSARPYYRPDGALEVAQPEWDQLFLACGRRDGIGPGDILGAIVGEAKIDGSQVGKITVLETHTLAEVDRKVSAQVVQAVNGASLRGRSVRVDYDRPRVPGGASGRGSARASPGSSRTRGGRRPVPDRPGGSGGRSRAVGQPPERGTRPKRRP